MSAWKWKLMEMTCAEGTAQSVEKETLVLRGAAVSIRTPLGTIILSQNGYG